MTRDGREATRTVVRFGDRRLPPNFWARVTISANGCWLWTGAKDAGGYGKFRVGKRHPTAHGAAYQRLVGPVPNGLVLDHTCHDRDRCAGPCAHRSCVNPAHLEVVTQRVNVYRGKGFSAENARKTHCQHGHAFTPENTYSRSGGRRECRTCRSIASEARNRATKTTAPGTDIPGAI